MSDEQLFTSAEEAALIVSSLSEETRIKVGALLLEELARHEQKTHPVTAEAIAGDEEETREVLHRLIRESEAERDIEVLAMICTWFVMRADKQSLYSLLYFIEHNEGDDADEQESSHS